MNHHYRDITDKLGKPTWWDECGVPRYCEFGPDKNSNIYADEVALLEIACQNCGRRFKVAMSSSLFDRINRGMPGPPLRPLSDLVRNGSIHYGDPPNYGCCPAGPTMNCDDLRVLEFWAKPKKTCTLERVEELEIELPDAKAERGSDDH